MKKYLKNPFESILGTSKKSKTTFDIACILTSITLSILAFNYDISSFECKCILGVATIFATTWIISHNKEFYAAIFFAEIYYLLLLCSLLFFCIDLYLSLSYLNNYGKLICILLISFSVFIGSIYLISRLRIIISLIHKIFKTSTIRLTHSIRLFINKLGTLIKNITMLFLSINELLIAIKTIKKNIS
ncbi:MAG: hypothetical protein E7290_01515 [Lachnospiraceae bacterium]|nr:hypothetical protein [Lachnospiraceae bacterium]